MFKHVVKIGLLVFLSALIACGAKSTPEKNAQDAPVQDESEYSEITNENLKTNKKELLEQMANELYAEDEKTIEELPDVKMDERGIYDDIKPVEVEIDLVPSLDLGLAIEEEEVKESKAKKSD